MTTDQALAWMAQWRSGAEALDEQHKRELRGLSATSALAASEALLSLADPSQLRAERRSSSGLVDQQNLLHSRQR